MKIAWFYVEEREGVKMVWIQDFEMDLGFTKFTEQQIEGFINEHSRHNMKIFKEVIEREADLSRHPDETSGVGMPTSSKKH
jgi:hypothetical protein